MEEELKRAITVLLKAIAEGMLPDAALKYTQAALNLAHVAQVLKEVEKK